MSGLLAGKVWQSNLYPDLKPLAAALADIANDDGTSIYPSVAYMCWLLGRSERAVQVQLRRLKEMRVLQTVREGGGWGPFGGKTTEYRLLEENLPKRQPWRTVRLQSTRRGAVTAGGALGDTQGCSLSRTAVSPAAPDPSLEPLDTGINPKAARKPRARCAPTVPLEEKQRRVQERDDRSDRERQLRFELAVGSGPELPVGARVIRSKSAAQPDSRLSEIEARPSAREDMTLQEIAEELKAARKAILADGRG